MNAAILLVSSALAGQTPDVIIPVHYGQASCCGTSCGTSCGDCCNDGIGQRLRDRFRGLFHRDCCDTCGSTCQTSCHTTCAPACRSTCDSCNSCGRCFGNGELLGRLRGLFHRDCCGCETSCCGSAPAGGPAAAPEAIKEQPKKMPSKTPPPPAKEEASILVTPPAQALPAIQNAPAIAPAAPALAPRIIENDTRNPF